MDRIPPARDGFDVGDVTSAYRRAREGTLWVRHPAPGRVTLGGTTRMDFLHRMSTQDLLDQPDMSYRPAVLPTALARIVDAVGVIRRPNDLVLLTSPGRAAHDRTWLARHVFFQDDIDLGPPTEGGDAFGVYGPSAREAARAILGGRELAAGEAAEVRGGLAWRIDHPTLDGIRFMFEGSPEGIPIVEAESSGAIDAYRALRIEAGISEFGSEIDEEANPLEVGLEDSISFSKGCYIGQEIIARMESRGVRARRLVGLRLEAEAHAPSPVRADGKEIGRLTSSGWSPGLGWIGLAVIRTSALEGSGAFGVGEGLVRAAWVELPMARGGSEAAGGIQAR